MKMQTLGLKVRGDVNLSDTCPGIISVSIHAPDGASYLRECARVRTAVMFISSYLNQTTRRAVGRYQVVSIHSAVMSGEYPNVTVRWPKSSPLSPGYFMKPPVPNRHYVFLVLKQNSTSVAISHLRVAREYMKGAVKLARAYDRELYPVEIPSPKGDVL